MPRPASKSGVSKLASGKWRWRLMLDGVRYTGIADTEAAAKLARAEAEINAEVCRRLEALGACPTCGHRSAS